MLRVVCLLIGYVFGLFSTSVVYCRINGVDIKSVGSGNAGTTNTLRVLGAKAGGIVLLGDMLKCYIAVKIGQYVFGHFYPDMKYLFMIYAAFGAVLGHDFPFYAGFKGGKGIACTAGNIIAFGWKYVLVGVFTFFIPFNITHYVSLGSLVLYSGFFIQLVITGQMGLLGMSSAHLIELYIVAFVMTALAFYQHRGNIVRLIHGQERKTYVFKKNKID